MGAKTRSRSGLPSLLESSFTILALSIHDTDAVNPGSKLGVAIVRSDARSPGAERATILRRNVTLHLSMPSAHKLDLAPHPQPLIISSPDTRTSQSCRTRASHAGGAPGKGQEGLTSQTGV